MSGHHTDPFPSLTKTNPPPATWTLKNTDVPPGQLAPTSGASARVMPDPRMGVCELMPWTQLCLGLSRIRQTRDLDDLERL